MNGAFSVTFLPEKITVQVTPGTNLLIAAASAGIVMESPCGGRGTCGKCAVRVVEGSFDGGIDAHLSEELREMGYVLACRVQVHDDLVVAIPAFSRLSRHKVLLSSKERGATQISRYLSQNPINPLCRKVQIKLAAPSLTDTVNDLERLKAALSKEYGFKEIRTSIAVLRKFPETLRKGNWDITVTLVHFDDDVEILNIEPGESSTPAYGLAIDIGTTTVAVNLVEMEKGKTVASAGSYNRQALHGADVISRIIYTEEQPNGLGVLQKAVMDTVNDLIDELLARTGLGKSDILIAVVAGNTVMMHLLMAVSPTWLRVEPYVPAAVVFPILKAGELGLEIEPHSPVITVPSVASYVGGDITAGVLATHFCQSTELTLFIDIGTNGELVLGNHEWLVTCACSAGPAFEGSGISCGMRAMDGAIDQVDIDPGTYAATYNVIAGTKPLGICGSGLIQCLADMKQAGIIDRAGKIVEKEASPLIRRGSEGMEFVLVKARDSGTGQDIVVTEGDLKNLIRAKGAIFAGIRTMLQMVELDISDIDRVFIAGGFGNYLNITDAIRIGLLPDIPVDKYEYVGNTSLQGAMTALLSRAGCAEATDIANQMTYMELSLGNRFMEEFISAMFIPHTDLGLFPSLD